MDMREHTPIFDYFIIATGTSRRQIHAMSEEIDHKLEDDLNDRRMNIDGYDESRWIVLDYGTVVIHLFDEETRALNGKVEIGDNMRVYFSGSYGAHNSYYSQGMYFGYLQSGDDLDVKLYNLTFFKHILDYMPQKRADRIRRKIEKDMVKLHDDA